MAKKNPPIEKKTLFENVNLFLEKREWILFWILFFLTLLFSILLYDPRVSLSGDDAGYVVRANNFLKNFDLPTYQGPLYPIVLSPIIMITGLSLLPLKAFSLVSMMGFFYLTFITYRKKIPALLLFSVLILISVNSGILYYASQTYSEAFYMFIQALVLYFFGRFFINDINSLNSWGSTIRKHSCLALIILAAALTRSVGFSIIMGVAGYFLFYKRWKDLSLSLGCFIFIFLIYSIIKYLIWGEGELQFSTQGSSFLQKDFYHPEYGRETISGFFNRFLENSNQYLSSGVKRIIGLDENPGNNSLFMAFIIYLVAIVGLFFSYKKNRYLFLTGLITGTFLLVTFFSLHVFWNQERLIVPVFPYILLILFSTIYFLLEKKKYNSLQFLYFIPVFLIFCISLKQLNKDIESAKKLKDEYSGLTPDWINYTKASHWISKNLKESDLVACRKPDISSIYANGKLFYGIYNVPPGNSDYFLENWKENRDKYIAIPSDILFQVPFFELISKNNHAKLQLENRYLTVVNNIDTLTQSLQQMNIEILGFDDINKQVNNNFGVFYADSLLHYLNQGNVTHILTANLRLNPAANTGQIISTVERYAFFIQEKYPYIFEKIHQVGADNNEPAQILKINWEQAGY